jgi:hypothetical protein
MPRTRPTDALGYAGLIPFAASSGALAAGFHAELAVRSLLGYGAVILSFIGAVHWGYALRDGGGGPGAFVASVLPSLVGWVSLLLAATTTQGALALQMAAFAAWLAWEHRCGFGPPGYRRLRWRLTIGVVTLLGIGLLSIVVRSA